ncbi:hypothetical protein FVE85_2491 [Porphyridium purpureum]|uniref:Uncharacterized protein n=1 Tax=Porphyridium purpureum TaxID=35688 RepID=A0A5J4YJ90_PORPP|nr:hypothetical protein FVE85_2491 [Porphyridium purpureum]|eukprot:POR4839..scf291_13
MLWSSGMGRGEERERREIGDITGREDGRTKDRVGRGERHGATMGKGGYGTVRRTDTLYREDNEAAAARTLAYRRLEMERHSMLPSGDVHMDADAARQQGSGGEAPQQEQVEAPNARNEDDGYTSPSSVSNEPADVELNGAPQDEQKKIRFEEEPAVPATSTPADEDTGPVFIPASGPASGSGSRLGAGKGDHGKTAKVGNVPLSASPQTMGDRTTSSKDDSVFAHLHAAGSFVKSKTFRRQNTDEAAASQAALSRSQASASLDNKVTAANITVDIESFSFFSKGYWERVNHGFKYINDPESIPLRNLRDMHNSMMAIQEIYVVAGALACGFALTLMEVVDLSEADLGLYLTFVVFATFAFLSGICAVMIAVFNFMGFAVTPSSHTELLSVSLGQFLALPGTMLFVSLLTLACSVATSAFVVAFKSVRITVTILCSVSFLGIILSSTYLTGQIVAIRDYCIANPNPLDMGGGSRAQASRIGSQAIRQRNSSFQSRNDRDFGI